MEYPDYAKKALWEEYERLERSFSKVWGVLSPSHERDKVMFHIAAAKIELYRILKEEK